MIDYRKLATECHEALNKGFVLHGEDGETALRAITGYMYHKHPRRIANDIIDVMRDEPFESKDEMKKTRNNIIHSVNLDKDCVRYFQALVHLGYKPSHSIAKMKEAEDFVMELALSADDDDKLPCNPWVFYEFERSAFLVCELHLIRDAERELIKRIRSKKECIALES